MYQQRITSEKEKTLDPNDDIEELIELIDSSRRNRVIAKKIK